MWKLLTFLVICLSYTVKVCCGRGNANGELVKLSLKYNGTIDCFSCPDSVACAQAPENLRKDTAPQFQLHEDWSSAEIAVCRIDFGYWYSCANGPNSDGLAIKRRYLQKLRIFSDKHILGNHWEKSRGLYYECFENDCNRELPSCENRTNTTMPCRSQPGRIFDEDCSNDTISCYTCDKPEDCSKSVNELNTTMAFAGKEPRLSVCSAIFKVNKENDSSKYNVLSRDVSDSGQSAKSLEVKCTCWGRTCNSVRCDCLDSSCNKWDEPPCTPVNRKACTVTL